MSDFKDLLILSYFIQQKEMYAFSELQEILGLSRNQLSVRLDQLTDKALLIYGNELLSVSTKGKKIVLENKLEAFPFFSKNDYENDQAVKDSSLGIYDIYVPEDFDSKI